MRTKAGFLAAIIVGSAWVHAAPKEGTDANGALALAVQLEEAFVTVAERSFPAVVVITNKQIEQRAMYPQLPPQWRQFFGPYQGEGQGMDQQQQRGRKVPQPVGRGSGVIIRQDGYILTNYHVVQDNEALEVRLNDGRVFDSGRDKDEVKVVGMDKETDLAVIRIGNGDVTGLPVLEFADSSKTRIGQWAIAVGAPFEFDYSVTVGHVSQKGRHDMGITTFENFIQTDASINPGNSGGPLLSIRGEVIGINDFIVTGGGMSRGNIGIGFAIASNLAKQVSNDLIEHGDVVRPFLGISMQPLTDELKEQFGVEFGVLVSEVLPGDPAEKAGIEPGDVILKIGDKQVRTPHDLLFAVLDYNPGDKVKVVLDRRGKKKELFVVARRRGEEEEVSGGVIESRDDLLNELGLALEELPEGVVVSGVVTGSQAGLAGLRREDLILEVNRAKVKSVRDIIRALGATEGDTAVLYIRRGNTRRFVPIRVKADDGE